ncbi:MAG: hypothetical protein J6X93_04300 [Bacilli bacterium]|nr:hypothetical protein [Bacilli bacterium]
MCKNVKVLEQTRRVIKRLLNDALVAKNEMQLKALTYEFALLYAAYTEAYFLKMLHSENCFPSDDYIYAILFFDTKKQQERSYEQQWEKCISEGFKVITNNNNLGEIANKKKIVTELVKKYIIENREIRNKIAHGQWEVALNSKTTAVKNDMTNEINKLDFVKIDLCFDLYKKIINIVLMLLQSPYRGHYNNFYKDVEEVNLIAGKIEASSIDTKYKLISWKKDDENRRK